LTNTFIRYTVKNALPESDITRHRHRILYILMSIFYMSMVLKNCSDTEYSKLYFALVYGKKLW